MSKFSLKSEHFTTPIKLVLPGIIVSLIGASAGYYIFNNPDKARAKATYSTWQVINQFENMLEYNSDILPCNTSDQVEMKKDYLHLYEMTKQNLQDLKDEEKIDKRLAAILNMKIDSYNELKKITEGFLDTVQLINGEAGRGEITTQVKNQAISIMQSKYVSGLSHILLRDTTMIQKILDELNQSYGSYVDSFVVADRRQTPEQMNKLLAGEWITTDTVTMTIKPSGTGHWKHTSADFDFTWKVNSASTLLLTRNDNGKQIAFEIVKVNEHIMTFSFVGHNDVQMIANACRLK